MRGSAAAVRKFTQGRSILLFCFALAVLLLFTPDAHEESSPGATPAPASGPCASAAESTGATALMNGAVDSRCDALSRRHPHVGPASASCRAIRTFIPSSEQSAVGRLRVIKLEKHNWGLYGSRVVAALNTFYPRFRDETHTSKLRECRLSPSRSAECPGEARCSDSKCGRNRT